MRAGLVCAGVVLLCSVALSQDATPAGKDAPSNLKFAAADVRASKPSVTEGGGYLGDGRAEFHGGTLLDMISQAYGLTPDRILGGPTWLDRDRFEVIAKATPTTPQDQLQIMFQALLAERFDLKVRKEEKPLPVFVLTVSKRGLKMKPADEGEEPRFNGHRDGDTLKYEVQNTTIARLVERLRGMAGGYLDAPVIDKTGLTGAFNFSMSWTARGQLHKVGADGTANADVTFFDAVEKQLGLHLEKQPQPMPVVVVEHVNQKPADNPDTVTKALPPEPTEFEVATIKPSPPGVKGQNFRVLPSGQVELKNLTLKDLITVSFDIEDDRLVGAPKWIDEDRYDLVAKTAANMPFSAIQTMVKNLLTDRFALKVHDDQQPVPVFAIRVGKRTAKLKDSDGTARAGCKNALIDGKRTLTCENITMDEFAVKVRSAAPAYFNRAMVNLTEMKGTYDLVLSWAPRGRFDGGRGGGDQPPQPPPNAGAVTDPNGDMTVFEAIEKELGLKVVQEKHAMPVVVVDHIERKPKDN